MTRPILAAIVLTTTACGLLACEDLFEAPRADETHAIVADHHVGGDDSVANAPQLSGLFEPGGESAQRADSVTNLVQAESPAVAAVSAGFGHSCAILRGAGQGQLWCWGFNDWASLGDRTRVTKPYPVRAIGLDRIDDVSAGAGHTCALRDGSVLCWGDNRDGQIGNCATTSEPWPPVRVPSPVAGLPLGQASAISAGESHTCAIVSGGVMCWGDNLFSQMGQGTRGGDQPEARWVPGLEAGSGVTTLGAGSYHTCAGLASGGMKCWGNNHFCQLGNGGPCGPGPNTASHVVGLNLSYPVTSIAGGGFHTCASLSDGSAFCWGINVAGQLGDGSWATRSTPVMVTGLDQGVSSVGAGAESSCAVVEGGALCWGLNLWGKLGIGNGVPAGCVADANDPNFAIKCRAPVPVAGMSSGVASITGGFDHGCALRVSGQVRCWGNNAYGQVGNGRYGAAVIEPEALSWSAWPDPGGATLPTAPIGQACLAR